jgi:uncharacterized protein (TIGR02118 family)
MIKLISLVYRKKGLSDSDFYSYWKDKHGPLVSRIAPSLRRYVQNHPLDWPGLCDDADGIVEMWFDTVQDARSYLEWRDTAEAYELREDEDRFQDFRRTRRFAVVEHEFETVGRPWSPGASLPEGEG